MKKIFSLFAVLALFVTLSFGQTTPVVLTLTDLNGVPAFSDSSFNFGVSSINLFGNNTLAGVESDALINFTLNNLAGATTFVADNLFIGFRYERVLPSVSQWVQNNTNFQGSNFQPFVTVSFGDVKAGTTHFGTRFGAGFHYALNGSTTFGLGADFEVNYLPGIVNNTSQKWYLTIAITPVLLHF